jgi:Icc-related predicted phosphoesterase
MRICCISDLHGELPDIPPCDVLAIAGDICPDYRGGRRVSAERQVVFLNERFESWVGALPCRNVIGCFGNHDWVGVDAIDQVSTLVRSWIKTDEPTVIDGVKFWTTPWQPWFGDWAFTAPRDGEAFLAERWRTIPADTDVLIVHGPPRGYGDFTVSGTRTGSISLADRIAEIQPLLVVCGHIHEGYGVYYLGESVIANASLHNVHYQLTNPPIVFDLWKVTDPQTGHVTRTVFRVE